MSEKSEFWAFARDLFGLPHHSSTAPKSDGYSPCHLSPDLICAMEKGAITGKPLHLKIRGKSYVLTIAREGANAS